MTRRTPDVGALSPQPETQKPRAQPSLNATKTEPSKQSVSWSLVADNLVGLAVRTKASPYASIYPDERHARQAMQLPPKTRPMCPGSAQSVQCVQEKIVVSLFLLQELCRPSDPDS